MAQRAASKLYGSSFGQSKIGRLVHVPNIRMEVGIPGIAIFTLRVSFHEAASPFFV